MRFRGEALTAALGALMLAACGTDSQTSQTATGTDRGTLAQNPPPRIASLTAADLASELSASGASGQQLLQLAGQPACGVDFYYMSYYTTGAAGEAESATGALMVPTGAAGQCSGPRPMVLYAHGTSADKTYNIANITNPANTEGALIAAMFAAQGFIVVAPNYVGYDTSSASVHPFLNGDQQSRDMMDALKAARQALPNTFASATSDSGKLFITGYSEGGYVAMATHKALQAAGQPVVASAPMSGPYALAAFGDAIFFGNVNVGSTIFAPLVARSYQAAYNNVYAQPGDLYESAYAQNAATLLPSTQPLDQIFSSNMLPQTALFSPTPPTTGNAQLDALLAVPDPATNPIGFAGFGTPNLITNSYRVAYAADAAANPDQAVVGTGFQPAATPQHPLRQDLKNNDMRSWVPTSPMLLCGGDQDPTVFFSVNTGVMQGYWSALPPGLVNVLDVNADPTAADSAATAALKVAFKQTLNGIVSAQGQQAAVAAYHSTVAPFCTRAAVGFFAQFLAPPQS